MAKKKVECKEEKNVILWNLVNSGLAGAIAMSGAIVNGDITWRSFYVALMVSFVVAVTKFRDFWSTTEKKFSTKRIFNFV